MAKARLIAFGSYLPERILSNQELEQKVDTSHEWIVSRTGIHERRIAAAGEYPSDMGLVAAKKALESKQISPDDVEMILVATMTPDYPSPSTAALIQHQLGAKHAAAMDIQAACTGYLYGLSMAKGYVESGIYRSVLVIATEKMSSLMNYKDRNTCVLFGDGASAALVTDEGEGLALDVVQLGADGSLANLVIVPGGGSRHPASHETVDQGMHYFQMQGREVFKHAVRRMSAAADKCLHEAGITAESVSWLVPHQANERILEALSKNFNISMEKVVKTIHKYGNTSAASVAIALEELVTEKPIAPGDHILLVAFGGGLTWGAALLTKIGGDS